MNHKQVLIIGSVWPEPNSSAAGSRMMQLIQLFIEENYAVIFATATAESTYRYPLEELGVSINEIELNDSKFDDYVKNLDPEVVLFDRFMTEEQFGWRVEKNSPNSIRILDTEDLHCLRKARQLATKEQRKFSLEDLNSDIAKREVASIFRSDLSLMISSYEMDLLHGFFHVPKSIICYVPFLLEAIDEHQKSDLPEFEERAHFVTIGSFRHEPNWDSVLFIKQEIWPVLRKKLPQAEMHIYGSYPPEKAMQLHKPSERFFIEGWAKDASEVLKNAKVLLAPLRFGAGLKGKFIDAMKNGLPSVTTTIGAEAMHEGLPWCGVVANEIDALVSAAENLYRNIELWKDAQQKGFDIVEQCFSKVKYSKNLLVNISEIRKDLNKHRNSNFIGSMLLYHNMRSTEFMSRWIEEKNKKQ